MREKVVLGIVFFVMLFLFVLSATAVDTERTVTIVRDRWGIPHIYGETDADTAYGLAWAHCEDAFELIQRNLLPAKGLMGSVTGIDGALMDFAFQFFDVPRLVAERYETDLSPGFRSILESYVSAVNRYAEEHPEEVLIARAFPFSPQDIIRSYVGIGILLAGAGLDFDAIEGGFLEEIYKVNDPGSGSNAMAVGPSRTTDGSTFLLVNSHQPLEGPLAWYEAHVNSDEGWNCYGGLFPGAVSILLGCNPDLGWAHTTDYHNFSEIYELRVNPLTRRYYYEGEWRSFTWRTARLRIKLGPFYLNYRKPIPVSVHGPVYRKRGRWYALRYPAAMEIRQAEQWFRMNKARSFVEFEEIMRMGAMPLYNVIYGDRDGNIYLLSDGRIPERDPSLDWSRPVDGTDSRYLWHDLLPYDRKIKYRNPECGFLFNCNGTPLQATVEEENSTEYFPGLQLFTYNRNERFSKLLSEHLGPFDDADLRRIKFDTRYDADGIYAKNLRVFAELDPDEYPDLWEAIDWFRQWDLSGAVDDRYAALAMLAGKFLDQRLDIPRGFLLIQPLSIAEDDAVTALREARDYLEEQFGTIDVELGRVQRLARGTVSIPIGGLPEVPRAVDTKYDDDLETWKVRAGDGFMMFIHFTEEGPRIQAAAPFGNSTHPDSPHYTDQMEMFAARKTRPVTLNRTEIERTAERAYEVIIE
jgi:acyl-homoserine-lactone acylase